MLLPIHFLFPPFRLSNITHMEVAESTRNFQQLISLPFIIIIAIVQIVLFARSVKLKKQLGYPKDKPGWPKRQRVRLLSLEKTEPLLELAIIGFFLWNELTSDGWHLLIGIVAITPGILLGRYRVKESFLEALPEHKAVVVRHTRGELLTLYVLIALKVFEGLAEGGALQFPYWLTLALTFGLVLVLTESTTRVFMLHKRYREWVPEKSAAE